MEDIDEKLLFQVKEKVKCIGQKRNTKLYVITFKIENKFKALMDTQNELSINIGTIRETENSK